MAELRPFDPVGAFQGARRNALAIQQSEQALEQQRQDAPRRNQLMDLKLQQAKVGAQRESTQFDQQQALQRATILNQTAKAFKGLDPSQYAAALASVEPELERFGIPRGTFTADQITPQSLDQVIAETQGFISSPDKLTASMREQQADIKAISPFLDEQGKFLPEKADAPGTAAAMRMGLIPKAGTATKEERLAVDPDLTTKVAGSQAEIAEAKQRGKLMADLDLRPSVQAEVERAVAQVKAESDIAKEVRSDNKAFEIYETALNGLFSALQGTNTGPIMGFLPALTAEQQIADGAVAAMEPVLKGIFRSAGEGTFTDADARRLLAMLPDRSTAPEARAQQIAMVDAIVRSKMGQPVNVRSSVLGRSVSMGDIFKEAVDNDMSIQEVMAELGIE